MASQSARAGRTRAAACRSLPFTPGCRAPLSLQAAWRNLPHTAALFTTDQHHCYLLAQSSWWASPLSLPTLSSNPDPELLLQDLLRGSSHNELHLPVSHIVYILLAAASSLGKSDSVVQVEPPPSLLHLCCTNPQLCHHTF